MFTLSFSRHRLQPLGSHPFLQCPKPLKNALLVFALCVMCTLSATASTPVASWYADGPLGECANFWGLQRYDVIARLHQGSAPDGTYSYSYDNGSTTITCSGGSCGEDLFVARDVHSDTLSETIPLVYSVTFNGQTFSGSVIKVRMCYSTHTEDNARCVIDAYVTTPTNTTPIDAKAGGDQCAGNVGMPRYSVHSMLGSLNIVDTPIGYAPQRGPAIAFTATYNQMERQQPEIFDYSNLGPKWTFNWLAYVIDDPATQRPATTVYVPGGGAETYLFDSATQTFAPHPQSHALLVHLNNPDHYERLFPDGSKQVFDRFQDTASYPRKIFMTQWVDPTGESAAIDYDTDQRYPLRIKKIRDALGFETNLEYNEPNYPYRISKVTEPTQFGLGRYASFAYTVGRLTSIRDMIGIQSIMGYEASTDSINSLTTPYGTTAFARGDSATTRWVEITDPLLGKERVEFRNDAPISATDPANSVPSGFTNAALNEANTFYWDKKAMQVAPRDYTQARITHWAKNADGSISGIVASEKAPLENRVWFRYDGQSDTNHTGPSANPVEVARVLDDGAIQSSQYVYNNFGRTTKETDPAGRVKRYVYDPANGIDLTAVFQRNPAGLSTDPDGFSADKIYGCAYTAFHQPHIVTDAAGQTTTYTYFPSKQLEKVENARHEITNYDYGDGSPGKPVGCLTSIASPLLAGGLRATTSFTYDAARRVHTVTSSPDEYIVTTDYDNLDRKTTVTYLDGTYEQFQYSQDFGQGLKPILDLTASRDRLGRWTYRHYTRNRQMDSITDPGPRTTLFDWCACGSLNSITDPNTNVTTFVRDVQSRLKFKIFAAGSGISTTVNYVYENTTSRLKSVTDALGQTSLYQYRKDDNLEQVSYPNALKPTPTVTFDYDLYYNRIKSMTTQGLGTTNYTYYPVGAPTLGANKLHTTYGLFANDTVEYTYDELGRMEGQSVNGVSQTVVRDPLGRVTDKSNALGPFTTVYDGPTPRLDTVTYPNGVKTHYAYFGVLQDLRLQTLQNALQGETTPLSSFDYTYDADGQIQTLDSNLGGKSNQRWFDYDGVRQLKSVHDAESLNDSTYALDFGYDLSGNRTSDRAYSPRTFNFGGLLHAYTPNALNQIGLVETTQSDGPTIPTWLTWDANGNMTYDGAHLTFEWDAANRLSAVHHTDSGERSEFAYDGLGRRVKITEYGPGVTATVKPKGSEWTTFNTAPFTLPTGSYTLTFEGLISNGDDLAIIDSVTLNSTLVANGNFEDPDVSQSSGGYQCRPSGAT